ncbi:MAG TPA: hypothetical protein VNM14_20790 [Planctomycetota bacterium]|nr:hypothetical protein [Planctomycetota bacterium]
MTRSWMRWTALVGVILGLGLLLTETSRQKPVAPRPLSSASPASSPPSDILPAGQNDEALLAHPKKAREVVIPEPVLVERAEDGVIRSGNNVCRQEFTRDGVRLQSKGGGLAWSLRDIHVGSRSLRQEGLLDDGAPQLDSKVVSYHRSAVCEKYDLLNDGVEQSFILDERVAALRKEGDLSIRIGLETALKPVARKAAGEETVELRDTFGKSVLTYGGAIAIDATGRTRPLSYHLQGGDLEMVLDAGFLATATFPLTVDPTIAVTKTSLVFNAPVGGPNPAPQTLRVINNDTVNMKWETVITYTPPGSGWLNVQPSKGNRRPGQSKSVTVSVNMTTLAGGDYTANLRFREKNSSTNFVDVTVTLHVRGLPFIDLSPGTGLAFTAPTGSGLQPTQTLRLTNQGGQPLTWNAVKSVTTPGGGTWLVKVEPVTGTLAGGAFTDLIVTVDATGLAGSVTPYAGQVTVSGNATNSPVSVPITLLVSDLPLLDLNPLSFDFNGPVSNPAPIFQDMVVRNGGGSPLNFSITIPGASTWLSASPDTVTGLLPGQTVTVQVAVTAVPSVGPALAAGFYSDQLHITGNALNAPLDVPVTFTVDDLPEIDAEPPTLTFDAPVGGPDPDIQVATVSNQGGGTLNWTASIFGGATWLSLNQTSGSLLAGASTDVQVIISVAGLAANTYSDTIIFDDGSGNTSQVFVSLSVNANPKIQLTPSSLVIDVPLNGSPATRPITIKNVGDGGTPLSWTSSSSAPWLTIGPSIGTVPTGGTAPLTVTVTPGANAAGSYVGQITFTSGNATNSPQTLSVTMNVNANPKILLDPFSVVFDVPQNGAAAQQTVTLTNVGDGGTPMSFSTSSNDPAWLTVTPASGNLSPGQSIDLTLTATPGSLAAKAYTALMTVDSGNATNAPQSVFVTMNVNANPKIVLDPTALVFDLPTGGTAASANVTLKNGGDGGTPLAFTTSSTDGTWLSVAPANGNVTSGSSTTLTVTATPGAKASGSYTARIIVGSPAGAGHATNAPQMIFVTMNLTGSPNIGVSPSPVTFSTGVGINPADQVITVTNTGGQPLNWTATSAVVTPLAGTWLSLVGTTNGVLNAGLQATFNAHVNVAGLTAGSYAGTITVSDPAAANNPQTINVTLDVLNSPTIGVAPTSLTFTTPIGVNPGNQTLTISNTGNQTLNWNAAPSVTTPVAGTWLSLVGTTSGALTTGTANFAASVNVSGLPAGTYSGTVTITGDVSTSNSPQTVPVTLRVLADPAIGLSPAAVTFTSIVGGASPGAQTVTVTNIGDLTLTWNAACSVTTPPGGTWLSLTGTTAGALNGGLSATFDAVADISGLPVGTYTGLITVTGAAGTTNSPQTIGVTLIVNPVPGSLIPKAGYCGATGLEVLMPFALLWGYRRFRRNGRKLPASLGRLGVFLAVLILGSAQAWAGGDELPRSLQQEEPPPRPQAPTPPQPQAEEGGNPDVLDFSKSALDAHVGFLSFSSKFESSAKFVGGIQYRVPSPLLSSIVDTDPERIGIFLDLSVSSIDRDIPATFDRTGTLLFVTLGTDAAFYKDEDWDFRGQIGVQYGNFGGVDGVDNGIAFLLGLRGALNVGEGIWIVLNPQVALAKQSNNIFFVNLGAEIKF